MALSVLITRAARLIDNSMLKERIITSLWYVPLLVIVIWFGRQLGFTILIVVFGILAALEFYRMVT
ncbi:MAG: hypothetical protein KAI42_00900, partial [Dehalococcoidales bacterium]|nr:hypothetical protein [Dehalococcoidales bacterium]